MSDGQRPSDGIELDRREVLRATCATAGLAGFGSAVTGGATADGTTPRVAVLPTTNFVKYYDRDSSDSYYDWTWTPAYEKTQSILDDVQDWWDTTINSRGNYPLDLVGCSELDWLEPYETTDYYGNSDYRTDAIGKIDSYAQDIAEMYGDRPVDAWLVPDYSSVSRRDDQFSYGRNNGAFVGEIRSFPEDTVNIAIVETSWEDEGDLPPSWDALKTEGIAFHELVNMFNGKDFDAWIWNEGTRYVPDLYSSILWDYTVAGCSPSVDTPDECKDAEDPSTSCPTRTSTVSQCNISAARTFYDDNQHEFGD